MNQTVEATVAGYGYVHIVGGKLAAREEVGLRMCDDCSINRRRYECRELEGGCTETGILTPFRPGIPSI